MIGIPVKTGNKREEIMQALFIDKIEWTINFPRFNYQMFFYKERENRCFFSTVISMRFNIITLFMYKSLNVRQRYLLFSNSIHSFSFSVENIHL